MRARIWAPALSAALAAAVPAAAGAPPRISTIVFATTRTPNWNAGDLFVADSARRPRNVTTTPGIHESDPDWSPSGTELAFSRRGAGSADIYVRGAVGAAQQLTTAPEADTSPVWSPDGRRIAFARAAEGRQVLWVMNRDGSNQRQLSRSPAEILTPSWSPGGDRIAYLESRRVAVVGVSGGELRIVREREDALAVSWRPDGRLVVVLDGPNGVRFVESLDVSGRDVRREANPCRTERPTWSSDHRHVLCTPLEGRTARVVRADGTEVRRLTLAPRNQSVHYVGFSLAAGGERLAYGAWVEQKDADLAAVGAAGAAPRILMTHPDEDIDPVLSPDRTRIAFVRGSYETADGEGALLLFERASGRVRRLAARAADPSWSPDARYLVYSRGGDLYRIRLADRRVTRLTRGRPHDLDPVWSPDGSRIAFVRYRNAGSILVLELRTRRTRTLVAGGHDVRDPAWSPRGDAIAFTTIHSLVTVQVVDRAARTLFRDADNPVSGPVWSPDGARILFTKGWRNDIPYPWHAPTAHFLSLFLVDAAGGAAARPFTRGPGWEFDADWRG